jgi:vancomycin resistance protein YoaR
MIPPLKDQAQNATIKRQDGKFILTDGKSGQKVDLEKSVQVIQDYFSGDWKNTVTKELKLLATVDEPDIQISDLEKIKDQLGTFTTSFTAGSNRGKNIANAASRVNGMVLMPGEEGSASTAMGERTEANGYLEAGSYLDGQTVQSLGGGVCQVSSTLYNAIILAELEITERWAHSMTVAYVKESMDAAIAEGYKDLKFKNNTDAPIYIEGYTKGGKITFNVYGRETRSADRKVTYVNEIVSKTEAKKKFVASGDAIGTLKKSDAGHDAIKAKLWKVVTENGVEVSREEVNKSNYASSTAIWSVGTATDNAEAKKIVTDAIKTQDEAKIKAATIIMPPGSSEHNLGYAMDIVCVDEWFEDTQEFKWLQEHAADYGFIMRYPESKQDITKVIYEPWHWRYVGVEAAKELKASGLVLEEYMGVAQ